MGLGTVVLTLVLPVTAEAAWVDRSLTLSRADFALDTGLGIGHVEKDFTGFGLNLELAAGLTSDVQLGIRTGIRFGTDGRVTRADQYGRTFDTETYGTGGDSVANPEISVLWAAARGAVAELGLEGRLYLPTEDGTNLGIMVAVPLRLHLGGAARLDTGIYVPIIFDDNKRTVVSFPFHLWFQISNRTWLGPLTGVRYHNPGGGTTVPLGFGLGYALSHATDLRTWLLFPDVNHDGSARNFGAGVGLEARF